MSVTTKKYTAAKGQSLFDIAVQEYGHIDGVVWLCQDNNIHSLPQENLMGQTFNLRTETINKKTVEELRPYNPIISKK